jgi:hypothetical protein
MNAIDAAEPAAKIARKCARQHAPARAPTMALFDSSLGPRPIGGLAPVAMAMLGGRRMSARSRRAGKADMSRPAFLCLVVAWAGTVGVLLVLALAIRWLA